MTPYDDLANSKYMGVAMALKFAVGAVKSGCNLLEGGVRTIVTAMCTGGRVSLMGADICAHMSKVPYFNDQVGSPNVVHLRNAGGRYRARRSQGPLEYR